VFIFFLILATCPPPHPLSCEHSDYIRTSGSVQVMDLIIQTSTASCPVMSPWLKCSSVPSSGTPSACFSELWRGLMNCAATTTTTSSSSSNINNNNNNKQAPWPLVHKRAMPTEGRCLSAKLVPTFASRRMSRGQRNGSPRPLISIS
jgi:hypothetical protein